MSTLFPQIIFAVVMLALGIAALLFPYEIRSWVLKVIGEKKGSFSLIDSAKAIWSIRCAGVGGILIGAFVLWMSWRNY
jgi:hypothetical protein